MSTELPTNRETQFGLRDLLLVTVFMAIGLALSLNANSPASVRMIGAGICLFWMAKCAFAGSTRINSPIRELLFLLALPIYLLCVICLAWGGVTTFWLLVYQL